MRLPYRAALDAINARCASYLDALMDPKLDAALRANMRERRDYWHSIGSRIRRRQDREMRRKLPPLPRDR